MKTAFVIFDRMTALDLIGVYDPLTRLNSMNFVTEFNWQIWAFILLNGLQVEKRGPESPNR